MKKIIYAFLFVSLLAATSIFSFSLGKFQGAIESDDFYRLGRIETYLRDLRMMRDPSFDLKSYISSQEENVSLDLFYLKYTPKLQDYLDHYFPPPTCWSPKMTKAGALNNAKEYLANFPKNNFILVSPDGKGFRPKRDESDVYGN